MEAFRERAIYRDVSVGAPSSPQTIAYGSEDPPKTVPSTCPQSCEVGIWLYIYLAVIIEEIPLPNIGALQHPIVELMGAPLGLLVEKRFIPTQRSGPDVLRRM